MGSIADIVFVDNLHIMFGEQYLLNTVNTIFRDMSPEYIPVMQQRLYQEMNTDPSPRADYQKELMLDYLSKLLGEFFGKVRNNVLKGGGHDKLEEVKTKIRQKVANIKPKFYT
jgi:hypothetical protein